MFSLSEIESIGESLLKRTSHPVPRLRIMRDVLGCSPDDPQLQQAHANMLDSHWAVELTKAQLNDGTWGRFHSRDSALKLPFPTTELALYRARALGIGPADAPVQKAISFMQAMLQGKADWNDPKEKHEGWTINTRFITAATLSSFDPFDPFLPPLADRWSRIVNATFKNGAYDPIAEREAHLQVNGIHSAGKYLKLASLYPLLLLSTHTVWLEPDVQNAFLDWVCTKTDGVYYVYGGRLVDPPPLNDVHFQNWLDALALILRFKNGSHLCTPMLNWLWHQRDVEDYWDFGAGARRNLSFPLSENWKNTLNRKIDCSISALSLLRTFVLA